MRLQHSAPAQARHNKYKDVEAMFLDGAPVDGRDQYGNTVLHVACQVRLPQAQLARAHARHCAVRHERHGFRTYGMGRIQNGHKRLAKSCLRAGSNVNSQNLKGQTPLHFCFAFGYPDRPPKP